MIRSSRFWYTRKTSKPTYHTSDNPVIMRDSLLNRNSVYIALNPTLLLCIRPQKRFYDPDEGKLSRWEPKEILSDIVANAQTNEPLQRLEKSVKTNETLYKDNREPINFNGLVHADCKDFSIILP